jgi:NAD(P)H-dependent FMN reductase
MPHIASIGFRERTSGLLAIPLYLFHKACGVDQLPLGLRQHWHIHLAAPAVHGLWHLSSGPVQTKSRARIVDEMARGVEWQELAELCPTTIDRTRYICPFDWPWVTGLRLPGQVRAKLAIHPATIPSKMVRLLSLSGSLRAASSNTHALVAAAMLAPPDVVIEHYDGTGELPHFNPDFEDNLPEKVIDLRTRVNHADGLLISCPEYARGIPGSFKNMLDWLVGSPDFSGKPVALFNTSPRASAAQDALKLVLETMSATLIPEACITLQLLGKQTDPVVIANDPVTKEMLQQALEAIVEHILTASPEVLRPHR